jgi:pimeloyl-ACP methyl ester carboxylesterase
MPTATIPNPARFEIGLKDGLMAGWRWRRAGAPRLVFCHATGFCASAYRRMLEAAANRFDIIAPDLRGHGRTRLPADPSRLESWTVYADDISDLLDRLGADAKEPVTLAGHSLGAVTVTLAARGRADVASLLLIEPVTLPRAVAALSATPLWPVVARRMPLVKGALSRRAEWPSRLDVMTSYARKRLFAPWAEGVLADYLEDGLIDDEGGCRLSCAPPWEAATFAAHRCDFWGAVSARSAPMRVLGADSPDSTLRFGAVRRFSRAGVEVARLAGVSHLLPMENPEAAAQFLRDCR